MGYTHYWQQTKQVADCEWEMLQATTRRILTHATDVRGIALSEDSDINRIPVINDEEIRFNGYGEEGYETFMIERNPSEGFCKTEHRDYAPVVVAVLQAAQIYCDGFRWTSDGRADKEHLEGVTLYNDATGAGWDYSNVSENQA